MVEGGAAPAPAGTSGPPGGPHDDPPGADAVEDFLGAAARVIARTEDLGPFTLVRPLHAGRIFARPRPGSDPVTTADLQHLAARFDELRADLALDWLLSRSPELVDRCQEAGLRTTTHPLLTLDPRTDPEASTDTGRRTGHGGASGPELVVLEPGSPLLRAALATVAVAFGSPSAETSDHGLDDRRLLETTYTADRLALLSDRIAAGQAVLVAALVGGEVAAVGHHRPVGTGAEIVATATLPRFRRRGLATALTRAQVQHARDHGVRLLLVSATDPVAEHLYAGLGFTTRDRAGQAVG